MLSSSFFLGGRGEGGISKIKILNSLKLIIGIPVKWNYMYLDQGFLGSWFSPPHHQCTRHCDTGHSCPYGFQLNKQTNKQTNKKKTVITKWTNNKRNNSCKTENIYCPNYSLWYKVMMITKLAQEKNVMSFWGFAKIILYICKKLPYKVVFIPS